MLPRLTSAYTGRRPHKYTPTTARIARWWRTRGFGLEEEQRVCRRASLAAPRSRSVLISTFISAVHAPASLYMSRLLLSAKALRHLSYHTRAHTTPRFVRHASAARALDGTQSLIRERLNAVSSTLADITAYADWQSIEQEAEKLKSELQVCTVPTCFTVLTPKFSQNEKAWEDKSQIAKALKTQSTLARLEKRISGYRELRIAVSDVRELAGSRLHGRAMTLYLYSIQTLQMTSYKNNYSLS